MTLPALRLPDPWDGCILWRIDLAAAPTHAGLECLDAEERARVARFVFDDDRRRYQVAHIAMRELLARVTGQRDAGSLRFTRNAFGKPKLANAPGWHFNLSHSRDVALLAINERQPVGVDVEARRPLPGLDALAHQYFTGAERRAMYDDDDHLGSFFRTWTRKEACLKAVGAGLTVDTRSIDTADDAGQVMLRDPVHGHHRIALVSSCLDPDLPFCVAAVRPESDAILSIRGPQAEEIA